MHSYKHVHINIILGCERYYTKNALCIIISFVHCSCVIHIVTYIVYYGNYCIAQCIILSFVTPFIITATLVMPLQLC